MKIDAQSTTFRPLRSQRPTIRRPRLIDALNRGLGEWAAQDGFATRLTLVTGPAGFGKTTLVADWLTSAQEMLDPLAVVWLDLESTHDDPQRFGYELLTAVSRLTAISVEDAGRSLPLASHLARTLSLLDQVDHPSVLVIDDYHLIRHPLIHEALNDLVGHLTPATHLVLLSRADPPLPLARLRTLGAMTEIRARDLRFTAGEAAEFLQTIMGLALTDDQVSVLERRTEGWVAGLQLAAFSLQLEEDPTSFLAAFAGDDRYVADYLLEEVLLRQPPDIQLFLLQTSILDHLDPELCDVVTGRTDSRAILAALDQANLFVVPLDARRHSYRYHRLFADLLSVRLIDSSEDHTRLQRHAAEWCYAAGLASEAVEHALATDDMAFAADLITRVAPGCFTSNQLTALVRWSRQLPSQELVSRPRLCLGAAWAALATGEPDLAERYVSFVESAVDGSVTDLCGHEPLAADVAAALIESAAVLSRIQIARLNATEALSLCHCALTQYRQLPHKLEEPTPETMADGPTGWPPYFNPPSAIEPVLLFNQGLAYSLDNRVADASRALAAAADLAQAEGNAHLVALALGHLAHVERVQGHFSLAAATCERGLRLVERISGSLTPLAGMLLAQQGNIAYGRGATADAERLWRRAIEVALPWENWEALLPGYVGLALLSRVNADWISAHDALDSLLEVTSDQTDVCEPIVAAYRAWFLAEAGETHAALQWAEGPSIGDQTNWGYLRDLENLCRVRVFMAVGDTERGESLAAGEAATAAADGRWGRWTDIQVTYAMALLANGHREAAQQALDAALIQASEDGFIQPFIEAGPRIGPLLQHALATPKTAPFARRILGAVTTPTRQDDTGLIDLGPDGGLLEALTDRELEVLQLIADGLSNKEIADTLFLTEGTVKNHAHSIYSKLDANGRTHAVARARTLGLLSPVL